MAYYLRMLELPDANSWDVALKMHFEYGETARHRAELQIHRWRKVLQRIIDLESSKPQGPLH